MSPSSDIDGSTTESDFSENDVEKTKQKEEVSIFICCCRAGFIGMHYYDTYLDKKESRQSLLACYEWVVEQLGDDKYCYSMFRTRRVVFDSLHETLVTNYGL